jgi:hypothetical protein
MQYYRISFVDEPNSLYLSIYPHRKTEPIRVELKKTRDIIREEQRIRAEEEAEKERKRRESEENERFRRAALAMETEAKPGMVWNPTTREYQALNTDESWRD